MLKKSEPAASPPRYMTLTEVAKELGISVESVRYKALVSHELEAVNVGNGSDRAVWRIVRASFDAFCERIEAEAARRAAS